VRWNCRSDYGSKVIGNPRVKNSEEISLEISKVDYAGVKIRDPLGSLYDSDESGGGTGPLVIYWILLDYNEPKV